MSELDQHALADCLSSLGLNVQDLRVESLSGGWNNQVYQLDLGQMRYCLKAYFHESGSLRLEREYRFLAFAHRQAIRQVPQTVAYWPERHWALYSWVEGDAYQLVNKDDVKSAHAFIEQLNRIQPDQTGLGPASEYCEKTLDHITHLQRRIRLLAASPVPLILELYQQRIAPLFKQIQQQMQSYQISSASLFESLHAEEYCVSPSDFGFHNALKTSEGPVFIDFEYAGIDDPAQLVCDFFCQFEVPAPLSAFELFSQRIANLYSRPEWHLARMRLLMPIHRLKWLGIALNHFTYAERRRFASKDSDLIRQTQINKADTLLNHLEKELEEWRTLTF